MLRLPLRGDFSRLLPIAHPEAGKVGGTQRGGFGHFWPNHRHAQKIRLELHEQIVGAGTAIDTQLAQFLISKGDLPDGVDSAGFIFADSTPLFISGTYNVVPAIDATFGIGLDLTPGDTVDAMGNVTEGSVGDTLSFLIGGRYYFGKL